MTRPLRHGSSEKPVQKMCFCFFVKGRRMTHFPKFSLPPPFIDILTRHISSFKQNLQIINNFHPQLINMILDVVFGLAFIGFLYYMFLLYFWSKIWECENWCRLSKIFFLKGEEYWRWVIWFEVSRNTKTGLHWLKWVNLYSWICICIRSRKTKPYINWVLTVSNQSV